MKTLDAAVLTYRQSRQATLVRNLLWVTATDLSTGNPVSIGFWNGDDNATIQVGGVGRLYYGAGTIIGVEPLVYTSGITVQMQHVQLSAITPEVETALRGYDTRLAPIEVHQIDLDPASGNVIGTPFSAFKGWIDELSINEAAIGGSYVGDLTLASSTRALTKNLTLTKSDAALEARNAGDTFRVDASIAGVIPYNWGGGTPTTPAAQHVSAAPAHGRNYMGPPAAPRPAGWQR